MLNFEMPNMNAGHTYSCREPRKRNTNRFDAFDYNSHVCSNQLSRLAENDFQQKRGPFLQFQH